MLAKILLIFTDLFQYISNLKNEIIRRKKNREIKIIIKESEKIKKEIDASEIDKLNKRLMK